MAIGSVLGIDAIEYDYHLIKQRQYENAQYRSFALHQYNWGGYGAHITQSGEMWIGALPPGQSVLAVPSRTIDKLRAEIKAWHGDLRA